MEGLNRAQGTATCLPPAEVPLVLDNPPGLVAPPWEELVPRLLLVDELVPWDELVPPGVVALPVLLPALELTDITAKSTRPEWGLMMTSLIVPTSLPELPLI